MLTTLTAPAAVLDRRAPPEGQALPPTKRPKIERSADPSRTLKMPREVWDRAADTANAELRNTSSVAEDAVLLFLLGDLTPRDMPRATYGGGGYPSCGSVKLTRIQLAKFDERAKAEKQRLGLRYLPSISTVVWQYFEDVYAPAE